MRLFLLLNVLFSLSYGEKIEGKIAGTVSKQAITYHQLNQMIFFKLMQANIDNAAQNRELFKKQALHELQRLLMMRWLCDQVKFSPNPKETDEIMLGIAKQNGKSLKEFEADLNQKGVSLKFVRFFVETNRQFASYVRFRFEKNIKITPEKVDNYKKKMEKAFKEKAFELEEAIVEGEQASAVAQQLIKNYKNQHIKGLNQQFKSLGWVSESDLGDLKDRVTSMVIGEAAVIQLTAQKYRIIVLKNKKIPGQNDPLDCFVTLGQIIVPKAHPNAEDLKIRFLDHMMLGHQWNQLERDAQQCDIQTTISPSIHVKSLDPQMLNQLKPLFKNARGSHLIDDAQAYIFVFLLEKNMPQPIKMPSDQDIRVILEQEEFKKCADKALHESKFLVHVDQRL